MPRQVLGLIFYPYIPELISLDGCEEKEDENRFVWMSVYSLGCFRNKALNNILSMLNL